MHSLRTKNKAEDDQPKIPQPWNIPPAHHGPSRNPSASDEFDFVPKPPKRANTMHSRYVQMLLEQDNIPKVHTVLAAFFVWLLLAGFLVFPATFTTISNSLEEKQNSDQWADKTAESIYKSVRNIPLLVIGAIICAVAVIGMACLSFRYRKNYVWMLNKLFLPGVANCLAGLISTLVGVYSSQHGVWSATAKFTAIAEGICLGVCATVWFLVDRYLLDKVKEVHGSHYDGWAKDEMDMPRHF